MSDENKPFDPFELTAAILLGLGAVGASVAGHQSGLWGGQSVEAYGEAAAMTTKASTTYNDELTTYLQDTQVDIRAKELIWEGDENKDDNAAGRQLAMANWLLLSQISDAAYKHLNLPADKRKAYWDGDEKVLLAHEELLGALEAELSQEYVDEVFSTSEEEFKAADKRFGEGRNANNRGDEFSLAGVILTVALFFAGLSLIFKTRMRWAFLSLGALVLVGGFGFMSTLTWA
jgi:uncharacterized protein YukE